MSWDREQHGMREIVKNLVVILQNTSIETAGGAPIALGLLPLGV
jgi:hypothetical protein